MKGALILIGCCSEGASKIGSFVDTMSFSVGCGIKKACFYSMCKRV